MLLEAETKFSLHDTTEEFFLIRSFFPDLPTKQN